MSNFHRNGPFSLYWRCQLIGWSAASLYWGYSAFLKKGFNLPLGIADFIFDVLIGIAITHLYRNFALRKNWHLLSLKELVPRILPAILVLSLSYMILIIGKLYIVRIFFSLFNEYYLDPVTVFFIDNGLTIFITGTRLLSIWVLAYHLYHYAQREISTARENARLAIIAKEAQLSNLSAQLNPHFFFNSLNNIKFLVTDNPVAARRAIDLLGDLLRNSLYGKQERLITLKEEMGFVKDYLELEKLRLEERLAINIVVDKQLENSFIPPLSIQTLVENAVKHGIDKRKEGGLVAIVVESKAGCIHISVSNSGILLPVANNKGLGLNNLTERLRLQYNEKASFNIGASDAETVLAIIKIPA